VQFLVRTVSLMPADFPADERKRLLADEQERSIALSESGKLLAHWKIPVKRETVTLWDVAGPEELHELVSSLPAAGWAKATATALVPRNLQRHAEDPANKIA
jgi:muconolactone D-isomerase